jgi:hypothetical protein
MMSFRGWGSCALVLALGVGASPASAQAFDIAPTYQASVADAFAEVSGVGFSAWGVMAGFRRPGSWSPHVWFQRYRIGSDCGLVSPGASDCGTEGWTMSIGPALTFLETPRWNGRFIGQVGVDSRSRSEWTGGAGIHMGVNLGAFRPEAFSRLDVFRGTGYTMVGVALRVRLSSGPVPGDPVWSR